MRLESARDRQSVRDWWELNELGTILHGERTGATLRLGDPIAVRVARVDAARGRVDLIPAPDAS
jgi:ribonuclease R